MCILGPKKLKTITEKLQLWNDKCKFVHLEVNTDVTVEVIECITRCLGAFGPQWTVFIMVMDTEIRMEMIKCTGLRGGSPMLKFEEGRKLLENRINTLNSVENSLKLNRHAVFYMIWEGLPDIEQGILWLAKEKWIKKGLGRNVTGIFQVEGEAKESIKSDLRTSYDCLLEEKISIEKSIVKLDKNIGVIFPASMFKGNLEALWQLWTNQDLESNLFRKFYKENGIDFSMFMWECLVTRALLSWRDVCDNQQAVKKPEDDPLIRVDNIYKNIAEGLYCEAYIDLFRIADYEDIED